MVKTTVLRVKRRRDEEPPPSTFILQPFALPSESQSSLDKDCPTSSKPKKQKEKEDAAYLTQIMQQTTFLNDSNEHLRSTTSDEGSIIGRTATTTTNTNNHDNLPPNKNETPKEKNTKNQTKPKTKKAIIFKRVINGSDNGAFDFESHQTIADTMALQQSLSQTNSPSPLSIEDSMLDTNVCKKRKLDKVQIVDARLDSVNPSLNNSTTIDIADNKKHISTNTNYRQTHPLVHNNDAHQTKRKRISLQMLETQTMTGTEFWNGQWQRLAKKNQASPPSTREGKRLSSSALRERMKRSAASKSHQMSATQSSSNSRIQQQNLNSKTIILDPLSKRIDESLCALITTTHSVSANTTTNYIESPNDPFSLHLQLIQSSIVPRKSKSKYLNWNCTNGTGTFLHATSLLNRADVTRHLFSLYSATLDLNLKDDGGKTAREIAEACDSIGVMEVFDRYAEVMGIRIENEKLDKKLVESRNENKVKAERDKDAEERQVGDYVYDLYWIQENENNDDTLEKKDVEDIECIEEDDSGKTGDTHGSNVSSKMSKSERQEPIMNDNKEQTDHAPLTLQMHGSIGYWDEYGELVIEAANINNIHDESGGNGTDMMTNLDEYGDDHDSNCEEFDGNDYPEEEDGDDDDDISRGMSHKRSTHDNHFYKERYKTTMSDSDDDDHYSDLANFRNHPVDLSNYEGFGQYHARRGDGFYADYSNNAEYDNEYEEYSHYTESAHNGELSSVQWGNQAPHAERPYAYDPDFDE